jgi:hypothetical protein
MCELWTFPQYTAKLNYCLILKPFFLGMPPPWGFTLHLKSRCNMSLLFLEGYSWMWGIQHFKYTRIFQSDLWISDILFWSHSAGIGWVFFIMFNMCMIVCFHHMLRFFAKSFICRFYMTISSCMVVPGPFQRQLQNNYLIFKPNYFIITSFFY